MKKGLFTLLLILMTALPALAAPTSGPWGINISSFTSFSSAKRSPVTAGKTMVITTPMNCGDLTIPADRAIEVKKGGKIRYSGNLVILGPFNAGLYQALEKVGSGTVTGLKEVPLEWYGGEVGIADNATAMTNALTTGGVITLGGIYNMTPISHSGVVRIKGIGPASGIRCSGYAITVTNGTGSHVENVGFYAPTGAYMVNRWAADGSLLGTPVYGFDLAEGYQLGGNDPEWGSLPENQKTYIVSGLKFSGGNEIHLSHIYGRFASLWLVDVNNSSVVNSNFHGGATTYGGIYFGATSGTKLRGNKVQGNQVRYATNCGITFEGQEGINISGNTTLMNGETGIKSQQNTFASSLAIIAGNISNSNYYDGFDLLTNFPPSGVGATSSHSVVGNVAKFNRLSGINIEGTGNNIRGGEIVGNGAFGIWGKYLSYSLVDGVMMQNNTNNATAGYASLYVEGSNNTLSLNHINNSDPAYQVNNCLFLKGNNNRYYGNDFNTAFGTSVYSEGTNNTGFANKGLKAIGDYSLSRNNMVAVDNIEQGAAEVGLDFVINWGMRKPTGNIKSILTVSTPGAEWANMEFSLLQNGTEIIPLHLDASGRIHLKTGLTAYADNAAAAAAGLVAGTVYRTATGQLMVVY